MSMTVCDKKEAHLSIRQDLRDLSNGVGDVVLDHLAAVS